SFRLPSSCIPQVALYAIRPIKASDFRIGYNQHVQTTWLRGGYTYSLELERVPFIATVPAATRHPPRRRTSVRPRHGSWCACAKATMCLIDPLAVAADIALDRAAGP